MNKCLFLRLSALSLMMMYLLLFSVSAMRSPCFPYLLIVASMVMVGLSLVLVCVVEVFEELFYF